MVARLGLWQCESCQLENELEFKVLMLGFVTGLRSTMGDMLRQIVSPLHDLGYAIDPFLLVRRITSQLTSSILTSKT